MEWFTTFMFYCNVYWLLNELKMVVEQWVNDSGVCVRFRFYCAQLKLVRKIAGKRSVYLQFTLITHWYQEPQMQRLRYVRRSKLLDFWPVINDKLCKECEKAHSTRYIHTQTQRICCFECCQHLKKSILGKRNL